MASSLTIENVDASYGAVRVLEEVTIDVKPGEMVVLVLTGHALKDADFTLRFHRGDLFTGTPHDAESAILKPLQRSPLLLEPSVDAVVELLRSAEN